MFLGLPSYFDENQDAPPYYDIVNLVVNIIEFFQLVSMPFDARQYTLLTHKSVVVLWFSASELNILEVLKE